MALFDSEKNNAEKTRIVTQFMAEFEALHESKMPPSMRVKTHDLLRRVMSRQIEGPYIFGSPEDWKDIEQAQYFECECRSEEHALRFAYTSMPDDQPEVYVSTFMDNSGFFSRVWRAIRYVLGYKCKYGHFDCFLLREPDADRLIDLLVKYRDDMKKCRQEYAEKYKKVPRCCFCGGTTVPLRGNNRNAIMCNDCWKRNMFVLGEEKDWKIIEKEKP